MNGENDRFINFLDSNALEALFTDNSCVPDREITREDLMRHADNMTEKEFRTMIMRNINDVSAELDQILEELDLVLEERRAYTNFLRKRTELWNCGHKRLLQSSDDDNDAVPFCDDSSETEVSSNEDCNAASSSLSETAQGITMPEKPSLKDYEFSEETLAFLEGKPFIKKKEFIVQRPRLEDYVFDPSEVGKAAATKKADTKVQPVVNVQKPALPDFLLPALPQQRMEGCGNKVSADLKYPDVGPDAKKRSGDSGKCSGSSLMGSFLSQQTPDFVFLPTAEPLVTADLGFNNRSSLPVEIGVNLSHKEFLDDHSYLQSQYL